MPGCLNAGVLGGWTPVLVEPAGRWGEVWASRNAGVGGMARRLKRAAWGRGWTPGRKAGVGGGGTPVQTAGAGGPWMLVKKGGA